MQIQAPLATITPTLDGRVLPVLAGADHGFTSGQIADLLGNVSRYGVRLVLQRLLSQGVVTADRVGNAYSYRLNRNHLAAEAIVALAEIPQRLIDRLTELSGSWNQPPVFAAVFGSAARYQMSPASDIDIFVVYRDGVDVEAFEYDVMEMTAQARSWTGNEVNAFLMSESEVKMGAIPTDSNIKEPVLLDILKDGVVFAGRQNWLQSQIRKARKNNESKNNTSTR